MHGRLLKSYPGYVPSTCGGNGRTNFRLKSKNIHRSRDGVRLHLLARKAMCSRLLSMPRCRCWRDRMERLRKSFREFECLTKCCNHQGDMSRKSLYPLDVRGFCNLMMAWCLSLDGTTLNPGLPGSSQRTRIPWPFCP